MNIIDAYVATTLLTVTLLAALLAAGLLLTALVAVVREHRGRRIARHQSIPSYYLRMAHAR